MRFDDVILFLLHTKNYKSNLLEISHIIFSLCNVRSNFQSWNVFSGLQIHKIIIAQLGASFSRFCYQSPSQYICVGDDMYFCQQKETLLHEIITAIQKIMAISCITTLKKMSIHAIVENAPRKSKKALNA